MSNILSTVPFKILALISGIFGHDEVLGVKTSRISYLVTKERKIDRESLIDKTGKYFMIFSVLLKKKLLDFL